MKPKSYRKYPRRCQNCKWVAMSMQTSFMTKKSDTFHCTRMEPVLPYNPSTDHDLYAKDQAKWARRTKVSNDGSCDEHEFAKRPGT